MRTIVGICMVLLLDVAGWACSCSVSLLCPSMSRSEAIFVGRVMDRDELQIQFTVEERFKGIAPDATSVTAIKDSLCGGGLEVGERYVVFVSLLGDTPFVPGCGMTGPVESSASTIEFLRGWASGKSRPKLRGLVIENESETHASIDRPRFDVLPLDNVEIRVRGEDGSSYVTQTNGRGIFAIDGVPGGDYKITASRSGYEPGQADYAVSVPPDGCGELNIAMWTASLIAGTVLQSDGSAAPNITVELSRVEEGELRWPTECLSDKDGRFEFRRVPPGTYIVGVNVDGGSNSEVPYPSSYYPDSTSLDSAERLEITGPSRLDNLTFRLGERLPTRDVEILMIWWDGSPVTNGSVGFDRDRTPDARGEHFSRDTDGRGRLRCSLLTDRQYTIAPGDLIWEHEFGPVRGRDPVVVEPGDAPVHLTFVISKANDKRAYKKPSTMSGFNKPCL